MLGKQTEAKVSSGSKTRGSRKKTADDDLPNGTIFCSSYGYIDLIHIRETGIEDRFAGEDLPRSCQEGHRHGRVDATNDQDERGQDDAGHTTARTGAQVHQGVRGAEDLHGHGSPRRAW